MIDAHVPLEKGDYSEEWIKHYPNETNAFL